MSRSGAGRVGFFSLLLLGPTTLGILGTGTSAPTAMALSHAVRIPVAVTKGMRAADSPDGWESTNWSGYAVNSGTYTSVSGSWTVPTVNPPVHPRRARQLSSTWVGIDGFNARDNNLIQAGTEQDWVHGAASYYAWWEILPASEMEITKLTVSPGDVMNVSIAQGDPDWTITVTDTTTAQSDTELEPYSGPLSSAEWIQEAPTIRSGIATLAHDTTVDFDQVTANGVDPELVSSDSGIMVNRSGRIVLSTPSLPNPDQNGFAVAYGSQQPPAPTD